MAKRVLLIAESLRSGNGGINRVARLTAKTLVELARRADVECRAISLSDDAPAADLGMDQVVCRGSRARCFCQTQRAALWSTHIVCDATNMARTHVVGRWLRRPLACWIHGIEIWPDASMSASKRRARRIARRADVLFANSHTTAQRSQLPEARVCWLGTESNEPASIGRSASPPRVLLLATLDVRYKGHRELLDCWGDVVAAVPDARLTFAGDGPGIAGLRAAARVHPAAASIDVVGYVPEDRLDKLYATSTVLAMPSRGEGFGLVYVEAMRHGLPIVSSRHDAGAEINQDGVTGYVVDLDAPGELASRLIDLTGNRAQAEALGRNAQQRWAAEFSYDCFRRRFIPLVSEFLQR